MDILAELGRDGWQRDGSLDVARREWEHNTHEYRARLEVEWCDGVHIRVHAMCVVAVTPTTRKRDVFLKSCVKNHGFDGLAVYCENGMSHLHAYFSLQESLVVRGGLRYVIQTSLVQTIEMLVDYYNHFESVSPLVTPTRWYELCRKRYASSRDGEPLSDSGYCHFLQTVLSPVRER